MCSVVPSATSSILTGNREPHLGYPWDEIGFSQNRIYFAHSRLPMMSLPTFPNQSLIICQARSETTGKNHIGCSGIFGVHLDRVPTHFVPTGTPTTSVQLIRVVGNRFRTADPPVFFAYSSFPWLVGRLHKHTQETS